MASLEDLERSYSPLPETVQSLIGGGGAHYCFAHPGGYVKTGVGMLGVGLDIRGDGGYVIVPPSLHRSGKRYTWELSHLPDETPLAPMPDWLLALCQDTPRRETIDAGAPIPQGQRNQTLFQLGCAMRRRGFAHPVILAALREINTTQCQPPLPDAEVERTAASCARYVAGMVPTDPQKDEDPQRHGQTPLCWDKAVSVEQFLQHQDADHEAWVRHLVVPGAITVIAAPRGTGKTITALIVGIALATGGRFRGDVVAHKRVMLVDRDNPAHVIRSRFRKLGATSVRDFKLLTRDEAPSLSDAAAWEQFPVTTYDVVLIDKC